jgi:ABC-type lipoprotein export system ATPase subunit
MRPKTGYLPIWCIVGLLCLVCSTPNVPAEPYRASDQSKLMGLHQKDDVQVRPYYGTYLVFIECAKQIQFRFHVVQPSARSTYGGVHIFGLQPGRHPVRMIIATDDGQRFETHFALIVKHEPEKRKFTDFEMGPDGKMIDTGKTIVVDLSYLKKAFRDSWGNHMEARAEAQKKGDKISLRVTLEFGSQIVYSHVEKMKNQPGCKTADVDPLLAKGGGAVTLLITQFGTDTNDIAPWQEMLRFAKLCKGVGSRTAYDVLAALVQHASNIAPKARQDTLGYAYELLGENMAGLSADRQSDVRNNRIGFIFQEHHLLPQCTVLENVLIPTIPGSHDPAERKDRAKELLSGVGLGDRLTHRPGQLSGGERQRVAVCRALINDPVLLLADEPTGSLDPKTAESVGELLLKLAADQNTMLLCVTHSLEFAGRFSRRLDLQDGQLVEVS